MLGINSAEIFEQGMTVGRTEGLESTFGQWLFLLLSLVMSSVATGGCSSHKSATEREKDSERTADCPKVALVRLPG